MSDRGYRDLREHLAALEEAGMVQRITTPINKDTQMHPLVRLQFRGLEEEDRRAFLFENVVDSNGKKYDMPVLICAMAGSTEIYSIGMQCTPDEIFSRWETALENTIKPKLIDDAPCQEIVITGDALKENGLSKLPVPISTPGFDNAPYTSASHWITKDPDQDLYNIGNYRGMIKANDRIGVICAGIGHGLRRQMNLWRHAGHERAPAAIAIGVPPYLSYTAVTRVPVDVSEYDVAGGLAGTPIQVTKAKTVDLIVPAEAEIIVEGTIPTKVLEMEGSFGEFPGYMATRDYSYFMDVTCITMRKKPLYLGFISQFPPSESSKIRHLGREPAAKAHLKAAGFDNVLDVKYFECSGSYTFSAVKIKKNNPDDGIKVLRAMAQKFIGKICVAVDEDIDIHNLEAVIGAMGWRQQPHRDIEIIDVPYGALDPSLLEPGADRGLSDPSQRPRSTGLLIDATLPWDYPPVSLPRKEFMEEAIQIWEELQLPQLALKTPWYGYELGKWADEEREEAKIATEGRYFETGEKFRNTRIEIDQDTEI